MGLLANKPTFTGFMFSLANKHNPKSLSKLAIIWFFALHYTALDALTCTALDYMM